MPVLAPSFPAPHIDSTAQSCSEETSNSVSIMAHPESPPENTVSRIPRVILDVESITNTLAAQLATSLLGHVLFLKSQIPFPVLQLHRIPMAKSNPRTIKSRSELLSSFDVLSSHLLSTFSALSTAFARSAQWSTKNGMDHRPQAFLAFCLGPSVSASKSRVFFGLEGLEAKIWGTRDDVPEEKAEEYDGEDTEEEESSEEEDAEEEDEEEADDIPDESDLDSDNETASDEEDSPAVSRSPSPVVEKVEPVTMPVMHYQSAEEDRLIKAADRLLSRTLAQAEADGSGMADELPPTQTHIMFRAPRRFAHPSWIPQQNISGMMDKTLEEFLSLDDDVRKGNAKPKRAKTKVEGIWISCKEASKPRLSQSVKEAEEEDEMIWWSWDGKIIGFSGCNIAVQTEARKAKFQSHMLVMRRYFLRLFSTEAKPREIYHSIPNLDPTKRRPSGARLDLSGFKTVFFQRYKSFARLGYAFDEPSSARIPFPNNTRGYLYYHVPPNGTMTQGELRFRLAETDGKFGAGEDLRMPDGSFWNVPLQRISEDPDMQAFLHRLIGRRPGRRDAKDSSLYQLEGWVSPDRLIRHVRKVPNLLPGYLRDEDFMDISGQGRPIFRHTRNSALSRLWYSSSYAPFEKYSPFPAGTRGFLYYYMPPVTDNLPAEVASLAGELRFRLTSTPFVESFADGVDLMAPNGLPWCIPLWHIVNASNMLPFLTKLTLRTKGPTEPALSQDTVERARNLFKPRHRYYNTVFQLDQPIAVKLDLKSVRLSLMSREGDQLIPFGLRLHNVLPKWKEGKGFKKSEIGSAHICISYSPTDFFVVRLLKIQNRPGAVPLTVLYHKPQPVKLILSQDQPRDALSNLRAMRRLMPSSYPSSRLSLENHPCAPQFHPEAV